MPVTRSLSFHMDTTAQRRKFALQAAAVAGCVAAAVTTLYVVSCDSDNSDAEDGTLTKALQRRLKQPSR